MGIVRYTEATQALAKDTLLSQNLEGNDCQILKYKITTSADISTSERTIFTWNGGGKILDVPYVLIKKANGVLVGTAKLTLTDNKTIKITAASAPGANATINLSMIIGY